MNPNPMTIVQLFTLLARMALVEVPSLHDGSPKHQEYLDGVNQMARIYLEVGSAGAIISPAADPLLLAAMGYEESRHRPQSPDGDCRFIDPRPKQECHAFGPMQVSKATPNVLGNIDPKWKGSTVESLRNPQTNVEAAYRLLAYYKESCKGGPSVWLGSWSAGRCTSKPIALGKRRCAIARALGDASGVEVAGCDTTGASDHVRALMRALKKQEK